MMFGKHGGRTVLFLVSPKHAQIIQYELPRGTSVLVLSSSDLPFAVGYESMLNTEGYDAMEQSYDKGEMNLALARELPDITKFIVIDPSYGYNAISVAPYAAAGGYYVLFADGDNIGDVDALLAGRTVDELILYGSLDRAVRDILADYNPDVLNYDGDRYRNNAEMVRRFFELNPTKQVLLTNGEFIEQELMSGSQAVLFIGTGNVPDVIKDFIKEEEVEVGVLIGNQYVSTATNIRRQTGISVFVKFARGARNPSGPISQVEGLDLFYLPSYAPRISVYSIVYNQITGQLEVTIRNEESFATYYRGTYTLYYGESETQRIGDIEPAYLDGNKYKTLTYEVGQITGDITADAFILFGESPGSLDYLLEHNDIPVDTTTILDNSLIEVEEVYYDAVRNRFVVILFNPGDTAVFADVELFDLVIAGDEIIVSADDVVKIEPGERGRVHLSATLEDEDYPDNRFINLRVFYGQREDHLVKTLIGKFELSVKAVDYLTYIMVFIVILLLLFFFLLFFRRKKEKKREKRYTSRWRGSSIKRRR